MDFASIKPTNTLHRVTVFTLTFVRMYYADKITQTASKLRNASPDQPDQLDAPDQRKGQSQARTHRRPSLISLPIEDQD